MAFIVPQVCRYTVHQNQDGNPVFNVVDMQIDTTGSSQSRGDAIAAQAGIIVSNWADHVMQYLANDLQATEVSWVDLDDEDGSTGSTSTGPQTDFPAVGGSASAPCPAGVCFLVKKNLEGSSRARRTGRMYLSGVATGHLDVNDGSLVDGATKTLIQAALNTFLGDITQTAFDPAGHTSKLVVPHILTRDPDTDAPLTGDYTDVSTLVLDSRVGFQKRRSGR